MTKSLARIQINELSPHLSYFFIFYKEEKQFSARIQFNEYS
ncbi:hypothetical protein SPYAA216_0754 [Streptococcus pyogenes AA216]|nr:hypothetical protein SPYAA216_0754 [Streptococcus pyogenes AA216]